tara:strand:- start:2472 stop:2648 length:177 start_codon:yes stop_codon:yes gene_type:complete
VVAERRLQMSKELNKKLSETLTEMLTEDLEEIENSKPKRNVSNSGLPEFDRIMNEIFG